MSDPSTTSCLGGRVVFLIDETEALREHIAGGTKNKAESIATALNSLLNQLVSVPDLEVAVAGYRGEGNGANVGCRWDGPLAGRRFVPTSALADAPLAVETRVRRVPAMLAGGHEEIVQFPIWYVPRLGDAVFPVLGYGYCRHLVVSGVAPQMAWSRPPLVISFVGDMLSQQVAYAVQRVRRPGHAGRAAAGVSRPPGRSRSVPRGALSVHRRTLAAGHALRPLPLVKRAAGIYDCGAARGKLARQHRRPRHDLQRLRRRLDTHVIAGEGVCRKRRLRFPLEYRL